MAPHLDLDCSDEMTAPLMNDGIAHRVFDGDCWKVPTKGRD